MVVDGVRSSPGDAVEDEDGRHHIRIGGGNAQERPRGSQRISPSTLPVAKRLAADADHRGELPARLMKFGANLAHVDGLKLAAVSCARPEMRPSATEFALEDERVEHRIRAVVGPAFGRMKCVAVLLRRASPDHTVVLRNFDARPVGPAGRVAQARVSG